MEPGNSPLHAAPPAKFDPYWEISFKGCGTKELSELLKYSEGRADVVSVQLPPPSEPDSDDYNDHIIPDINPIPPSNYHTHIDGAGGAEFCADSNHYPGGSRFSPTRWSDTIGFY